MRVLSLIVAYAMFIVIMAATDGCGVEPASTPVAVSAGGLVVCDGNSLTFRAQSDDSWPTELRRITGDHVENLGTWGFATEELLELAPYRVDPLHPDTVIIWEGINSFTVYKDSAVSTYGYLSQYIAGRHAAGVRHVVALTTTPSPELGKFQADYNALIVANRGGADQVVDLTQDPRLADPMNATYFYSDHLHLVDAGYRAVAEDVAKALK